MSAVGLVTVTPPELKTVRGEDIVKFDLAYDRYLRQVSEVNLTRPHSQRVTAAGYKACISSELLQSLVALRTFADCTEVEEVTNIMVKEWVQSRSRCSVDDMPAHVQDAVARVKFKQDRTDPHGACLQFFAEIITELRRSRVSHAINDAGKALITQIVPKLEPAVVRETIAAAMEFWPKQDRYDFHHFMRKVTEACIESAKYAPKRHRDDNGTKPKPNKHKKVRFDSANPSSKDSNAKRIGESQGKNSFVNWNLPCLNTKCDGVHPISKCGNTSEDEKKRLLKEYREKKKTERSKGKAASLKRGKLGEGRWEALIEDKVDVIALGDTGSDYTAMDRYTLQKLTDDGVFIKPNNLDHKLEMDAAIQLPNSVAFTASATVVADVTIKLPCGPLRLRNVEFHIIDQKMDEILLGRPLLKILGYDVENHLSKLRKHHTDIDVSRLLADHVNNDSPTPPCPRMKRVDSLPSYQGIWYGKTEDDPISPPESIGANIGEDSKSDIDEALENMLCRAADSGVSPEGRDELAELLYEYRDIFRIKLGCDPPAKVRPMEIRLRDNHNTHRSTQRRYAPPQRAFISSTIKKLEEVKAVYANPTSRWASPALAVAKPGPEKFRFTVDLRGPNKETHPVASAMPDMEGLIHSVAESKVFAKLDMCHAYWQIPLHPNSQECMSIQTPLGVFTPTRSLHGSTDSGNHFQSCMSEIFTAISDNIAHWQDDALVHAIDERMLLNVLRTSFEICRTHGLKLHAKKCQLFLRSARFCGRIIDSAGVQYDPQCLEALLEMRPPQFANDLQQFICATNWMRTSIPDFSRVVSPLHQLMEVCYKQAGKRTKRAVKKISLDELWGTVHDTAFATIKNQIAQRVKLSHPKKDRVLCLFSDASDTHWGSVLTQVRKEDMKKVLDEQDHEPLSFISGSFTGSLLNWSIVEKEAYAIVESMSRLEHMTGGSETTIFTDHANLVYIYDPIGQHPGIGRHVASKLLRWALKLSGYRYVIEHVSGEDNVWADILTRWAVKPRNRVRSVKMSRVMYAPITPGKDEYHEWPTRENVQKSQKICKEKHPNGMKMRDGIIQNDKGVVFIPRDDHVMKLRIAITAHTGMSGHRGRSTTKHVIAQHFYWKGMMEDIEDFCKSCLHCLSSFPGESVARPMGHSIHAKHPNEVMHFDFCYVGPGIEEAKYVLVLKDDLSSYVRLITCEAANAEHTVEALFDWFSTFGVVLQWVSDSGSHFKNEVMAGVRRKLRGSHHFTLPYCPWTNGTVEVVCRELVRCMKALLSEFKLPMKHWPEVLPLVQAALNNAPLQRLGGRCPLTAFTGLPSGNAVASLRSALDGKPTTVTLDQAKSAKLMEIERAHQAIDEMHRDVFQRVSDARKKKIIAHNKKTHVRECNLDVGDYVLRGMSKKMKGRKLMLRWTGPYVVTKVLSDFLFQVEDLRSQKKTVVHGTRLKFFRNNMFEVSEECKEQLAFQEDEYCVAEELQDIRINNGDAEVLVQWIGFEDEEPQWEPFAIIQEDIPKMLDDFIAELKTSGTAGQKRILSSLSL